MKLLGVFVLVLAVAANAHTAEKRAEMMSKVQATEFGATVLADLQERLRAGDPIDALREFITKIRKRIEEEGRASVAEQQEQSASCLDALVSVNQKINASLIEVATQKEIIRIETATIARLEAEIVAKEKQISDTKAAIAYNEESIALGDELRKQNEEEYKAATQDAKEVRAAVEEILSIESGSSLHANQNEGETLKNNAKSMTLDRVKDVRADQNTALLQLEAAASKIKDPTAQSFIQLAALSTEAFAGDIDDLRVLLNRLIEEVDGYTEALRQENEQNAADWAALKADMEEEIRDWQEDLIRLQGELDDLNQQLREAKQRKTDAINAYNAAIQELSGQYDTKRKLLKDCSDSYANYLIEQNQRKEELETLELIYQIIKDKLADADSEVKQTVDQLMTGGTYTRKCHCDHACSVFNDCCQGCDPTTLDKVPTTIKIPEYEGGEKERPSRDARALYGTYYDRAGGFHF